MPEPCATAVTRDDTGWDEYLRSACGAGLFHDPRWGQVMEAAYGNRAWYVTARREGRIVGVLQLVAQKSLLFGSHLCSLPYFDAAGVLADDAEAAATLVTAAEGLRQELHADWVELRQEFPLPGGLPARNEKLTVRLALPGEPEALWAQLKPKVRNQVRKAQGAGLTYTAGGAELLPVFYAIYALCMRNLGSPPHGQRFLREIVARFGEAVRVFVVRLPDGRAAAASFTLAGPQGVCVPWAGSDWRHAALCPNMLLYWEMLADACRRRTAPATPAPANLSPGSAAVPALAGAGSPAIRGQTWSFDFGRCTRDSGTHQFKKQWGGQEVSLCWQYLLPSGRQLPDLRPDSPKYRLLTACWKRLPVGVACAIGPRIIRRVS